MATDTRNPTITNSLSKEVMVVVTHTRTGCPSERGTPFIPLSLSGSRLRAFSIAQIDKRNLCGRSIPNGGYWF